jgi:hypothetical protein
LGQLDNTTPPQPLKTNPMACYSSLEKQQSCLVMAAEPDNLPFEVNPLLNFEGVSKDHPQCHRDVVVHYGRREWAESNANRTEEISVMSWNTLSDTWLR